MVNGKIFCHLTILLLSFYFMVAKCSLEPTNQFIDSSADTKQDALILHKRPSFFVGSRYGRSGSSSSGSVFATSKTRRLNVVPRNDRFFLSSRYGKRAGMDFLQNTHKNNNKNINDNSIIVPLLSTPYEQALISEISTGTQLSSKPIPLQQQQQQQHFNNDFNINRLLPQQTSSSSSSSSSLSSAVAPPYAHVSCVYTGLQNYYRCNSIYSVLYFKNSVINDNTDVNEALSTDDDADILLNNDHNDNDDSDDDNDNDVEANDEK